MNISNIALLSASPCLTATGFIAAPHFALLAPPRFSSGAASYGDTGYIAGPDTTALISHAAGPLGHSARAFGNAPAASVPPSSGYGASSGGDGISGDDREKIEAMIASIRQAAMSNPTTAEFMSLVDCNSLGSMRARLVFIKEIFELLPELPVHRDSVGELELLAALSALVEKIVPDPLANGGKRLINTGEMREAAAAMDKMLELAARREKKMAMMYQLDGEAGGVIASIYSTCASRGRYYKERLGNADPIGTILATLDIAARQEAGGRPDDLARDRIARYLSSVNLDSHSANPEKWALDKLRIAIRAHAAVLAQSKNRQHRDLTRLSADFRERWESFAMGMYTYSPWIFARIIDELERHAKNIPEIVQTARHFSSGFVSDLKFAGERLGLRVHPIDTHFDRRARP